MTREYGRNDREYGRNGKGVRSEGQDPRWEYIIVVISSTAGNDRGLLAESPLVIPSAARNLGGSGAGFLPSVEMTREYGGNDKEAWSERQGGSVEMKKIPAFGTASGCAMAWQSFVQAPATRH